jgi:hypothetical protein
MNGIGSDLSIENFLGIDSEKKPYNKFDSIGINILTLARNIYQSIDKLELPNLTAQNLATMVIDDIKELHLELTTNTKLAVYFYICSYHGVSKKDKGIILKTKFGEKRIEMDTLISSAMKIVGASLDDKKKALATLGMDINISIFDTDIYFKGCKNIALLTHIVIDLLSMYSFSKLTLLESYTGTLKTNIDWGSKINVTYSKPVKMTWFLLRIFGDGNEMLERSKPSIIKAFCHVGDKHKWDIMTTKDRMVSNIKSADQKISGMKELLELVLK